MAVPLLIENPSSVSAAAELVWSFSGTVSTDQNSNIPRYVPKTTQTFTELQLNCVSAPLGGSCTVVWKKNGVIVGTVVLNAGETLKRAVVAISLANLDEFYPEISALTTTTPPTTLTMVAR